MLSRLGSLEFPIQPLAGYLTIVQIIFFLRDNVNARKLLHINTINAEAPWLTNFWRFSIKSLLMGIFNCFSPPSWRVGKVAKNKGVYMEIPIILLILILITIINPRSLLEKIVTRSLEGEGGSIGPPPLLFSTQFIRLTWNLVHIVSFVFTFN